MTTDDARRVLRGSDGWLFLTGDSNDVIAQHEGRVTFDQRKAGLWRAALEHRVAMQERYGCVYSCAIAPDKEAVYAEHLPAEVTPASRRPVHDLLALATGVGADVRYLLQDLEAVKPSGELYPRTGTHWNHRGAYVAYGAICRQLTARGVVVPAVGEEDLFWHGTEAAQDLGSKLDPPEFSPLVNGGVPRGRGKLVADNLVRLHGRVVVFEHPDSQLPTGVMFGESFAYHLFGFLKESFRRLVFVHSSAVIEEAVAAEAPDAVFSLPVERFLIVPPVDEGALAMLRDTVRRKLDAGQVHRHEDPDTGAIVEPAVGEGALAPGELPW